MGRKMSSFLGIIFETLCFSPRSFVSSAATESVFHCVCNEKKILRETKKETEGKEGKTEKRVEGREIRGLGRVSVRFA